VEESVSVKYDTQIRYNRGVSVVIIVVVVAVVVVKNTNNKFVTGTIRKWRYVILR